MLCLIVLVLISECQSIPRQFSHPSMCELKGSTDCSFQMAHQSDFCVVYNTSECQNFDFSHWMKQPPKHATIQSESIYSVDASPFAMTVGEGLSLFFDALNITFTTSDKDVDGFVLLLEDSAVTFNICRVFDFRNSSTKGYVTLFYDCLVLLSDRGKNFELKVKALPQNEEMLYSLFLPRADNIEVDNLCQWRPVVMVFKGGFQNNIVEVKFSQAPKHWNVSSYEVSLVSNESGEPVQTVTTEAGQTALIHVMFSHVDRGSYSISVRPLSRVSPDNCKTERFTVFAIENKLIDKIIVMYIIAVCVVGFGIAITIQLFLRWLFRPGSLSSKPVVVLLVYSYDCKEHDNVVLRYVKYLENQCGMKVLTIYGDQRTEPDLWLIGPYRNCDIVMMIISEGVFYKCENRNKPPMIEGYPCGDRLISTVSHLKMKILTDEKKFIPVYFEYSGTCHIPSFIQSGKWEKAFVVPREMNHMLCKAYNQSPKIACLGVYPRMPGYDVVSSHEGMALIESIEEMKDFLNRNGDGSLMQTMKNIGFTCQRDAPHTDKLRNNSRLNAPSKHSYSYGHVCNDENCAHLNLLQESDVTKNKSDTEFNEKTVHGSAISDVTNNTEEISADRYMQDLQYILSKPGPSFPSLHSLKFMK